MKITVSHDGRTVEVEAGPVCFMLTAQEAYELYQRLAAALPQCVQPFEPVELDADAKPFD